MKVVDVMTSGIETISPNATLEQAAKKMYAHNVGVLPVVDDEKLVGVVTDRDLVVRGLARGCNAFWAMVREVMSQEPLSCYQDQSVAEASRLMEGNLVRRLLVLDRKDRVVGMVSLTDLALKGRNDRACGRLLSRISAPAA